MSELTFERVDGKGTYITVPNDVNTQAGGFGEVHKVKSDKQISLFEYIALKILHPNLDEAHVDRETRGLRTIHEYCCRHEANPLFGGICPPLTPHLFQIINKGTGKSHRAIDFPWIPGKTLSEIIKSEFPEESWSKDHNATDKSVNNAYKMARRLLEIICPLHEEGIPHLDLHARNIMVTTADEYNNLWVLDFGLMREVPIKPDHVHSLLSSIGNHGFPQCSLDPIAQELKGCAWKIDFFGIGNLTHSVLTGNLMPGPSRENPDTPTDRIKRLCACNVPPSFAKWVASMTSQKLKDRDRPENCRKAIELLESAYDLWRPIQKNILVRPSSATSNALARPKTTTPVSVKAKPPIIRGKRMRTVVAVVAAVMLLLALFMVAHKIAEYRHPQKTITAEREIREKILLDLANADLKIQNQDYSEARAIYQATLHSPAPNDLKPRMQQGYAYADAMLDGQRQFQTGAYDAAAKSFERAVDSGYGNPGDAAKQQDLTSGIAEAMRRTEANDYDGASNRFSKVAQGTPLEEQRRWPAKVREDMAFIDAMDKGMKGVASKEYDSAIASFKEARAVPGYGDYKHAIQMIAHAEDAKSTMIEDNIIAEKKTEVRKLIKDEMYDEAKQLLEEILKIRNDEEEAAAMLLEVAECIKRREDFNNAFTRGTRLLRLAEERKPRALEKDFADAAAAFSRALDVKGYENHRKAQEYHAYATAISEALAHMNQQNYQEADRSFSRAKEIESKWND